jgi:hypothetical protein
LIRELTRINNALTTLTSLQAQQFLEWKKFNDPRYSDPKRLLPYFFQVCSQNGEDGIIQEIFRRIGTTNRTFFEAGVGDGIENNTSFLLSLGWSGYWIDSHPNFLSALKKTQVLETGQLRYTVSALTRENCVSLLSQLGVPQEFDLLSVDIDQNTFYVWEALATHFHPRVVVVEYNGAIPPEIEWAVQYDSGRVWDGSQNYGASLKAYENLGKRLGYSLIGCDPIGVNAFFVGDEFAKPHFVEPFTAENHFEPARFNFIHRIGMANEILDIKRS